MTSAQGETSALRFWFVNNCTVQGFLQKLIYTQQVKKKKKKIILRSPKVHYRAYTKHATG
jgi:hypothetical protein